MRETHKTLSPNNMKTIHPSTIIKILKDNGFSIVQRYSNGRIKGLQSSNGDFSVSKFGNDVSVSSRKGNIKKIVSVLKNNGFTVFTWNHPSGFSSKTIVTKK